MRRGQRFIHRIVVSEPLALVPYECVYRWRRKPCLASRYDDPGLFEHRGLAVCHWRQDSTGAFSGGRWRWGKAEREAFAQVHNRLSEIMAQVLARIRHHYRRVVAFVSPKMTHRSFLTSQREKREAGLPGYRLGLGGRCALLGVNDRVPGLVEVVPKAVEWKEIQGPALTLPAALAVLDRYLQL